MNSKATNKIPTESIEIGASREQVHQAQDLPTASDPSGGGDSSTTRQSCQNNLKQIGLAIH